MKFEGPSIKKIEGQDNVLPPRRCSRFLSEYVDFGAMLARNARKAVRGDLTPPCSLPELSTPAFLALLPSRKSNDHVF